MIKGGAGKEAMSALAGGYSSRRRVHNDLVGVLREHSLERPDQTAFASLGDGETESVLTYFELDRRARAVATRLQELGFVGERVVLAYPSGLDFIVGFFACLYAGCVAVPTYLPHRRTLDRFRAIVADAGARLVLSTSTAQHQAFARLEDGRMHEAVPLQWLATDEVPPTLAMGWEPIQVRPEALAMLQYTSGSTRQPKGVMLSHANLIQNTRAIFEAFGMREERETAVFWLPMCHDMGLVGGILEPILAGASAMLMAPASFLRSPVSWLGAISRHRATISGGPNFAYELCVRSITDAQRATLDLSSWELAFVGAEPIQPETLERFAAAFGPCGFKCDAFYPCYGMAEATLMISGAVRCGGPAIREFDETALSEGRVESAVRSPGKARRLVSCGTPVGGLTVAIVDAEALTRVQPGRVGEIWVAGESIGQGYWNNPDDTLRSFDAHLRDAPGTAFLRTGDLGFVGEGELFVVGRHDDLIIVRGLNHNPQDLESTARKCHPWFDAGAGAAFDVQDHAGQQIVLVQEVARNGETDFTLAMEKCREAVLAEHGLVLHDIVLVRGGTVPRTTSGKIRRRACRAEFLAGTLRVVAKYCATPSTLVPVLTPSANATTSIAQPASPPAHTAVFSTVCQHAIALGGAALSSVTPETPLTALGLESLQRVELAATLEKTFACRLPDTDYCPTRTLGELADAVQKHLNDQARLGPIAVQVPPEHYDFVRFPEYAELKRYERMLKAVARENPYFRVDEGAGGTQAASVTLLAGRDVVNFGNYDYIGMAHDPAVLAAAKISIDRYGTSAGASRLVSGEKRVHRDLELALAGFLGTESALVFVSGHATNVTTIGHLMGPEDLIVYDVLAHNSIIQGAQLSGATRRAFAHNDAHALDALLSEVRHRYRRVLIAIEGVYSMDGDFPDLPRFVELKTMHKALMLVDEAHSLGTMGRTGRGIGEHWGVARNDVDLWMGTLSKSLASCGGYIAGSAEIVEYLAYTAPGFVYSVGLSPPNAAAALAAVTLLREQPERTSRLRELASFFLSLAKKRGLNTGSSAGTPVIPVIIGNSVKTLRLSEALLTRGIYVQPILHPAVPEHASRLRFFITIGHTEAQIRAAVSAVTDELARL